LRLYLPKILLIIPLFLVVHSDMESASGILAVMKQTGLEPSADSYTTLLCGYARKGDIGAINTLLEQCEKNEVYLLDKDLLDIIYGKLR
jgi:leucine-rich PPR motif-containing protein, mitochondrial